MRNVLVAGGAGFIGSHLCDALLARGDKVFCLDDLSRGTLDNLESAFKSSNFFFEQMDVGNARSLEPFMRDKGVDYVFHLAANSDIQASAKNPRIEFSATLSTTWSILSAMRNVGVKKLFFASTSAVYGEQGDKASREDDALAPISYYGAAKASSEATIRAFCHMNGIDACVFRFANVIGPRLTHGVIYDFVNKLTADPTTLKVLGDGSQTKPYVYVDDLIRAIIMSHDRVKGMDVYNVGVETSSSVSFIAELVREEMNASQARIEYGTEKIGWKGDVPRFRFDLSKIHATGWRAERTSDEAVRQTVREVLRCKR